MSQIKVCCRSYHEDQCLSKKTLTPLHGNLADDGDVLQNGVREQHSDWEILFCSILHTTEVASAGKYFSIQFSTLQRPLVHVFLLFNPSSGEWRTGSDRWM
jgi:hypothetical protein